MAKIAECMELLRWLDNTAFRKLVNGKLKDAEKLEQERDRLEIAVNRKDYDTMQEMLDKYSMV